jgi:integrase
MANKHRGKNEGSIFKRPNGIWRAQIMLNGNRFNYSAKTKLECQKWVQEIRNQLEEVQTPEPNDIELEVYLQEWLETAKPALRPKTSQQYEQLICKRINPVLGKMKLKELRPDRIDRYYAEMYQAGVGVRTIRYIHSILHRALERAVKYDIISRNPTHKAILPRKQQPEMSVLEESQVSALLIAAKTSRLEALFHLAVTTGMRQGEILGLKWPDIEWKSGILHVRRQVQRVPALVYVFGEPKTRAGKRTIKLGPSTLQALRAHWERQQLEKAAAGPSWQNNDLVFPSTHGTPLDQSNLLKEFKRILMLANLPHIRFHDLRHTAASLLINHGIPVIVVSRILGHSKPSVTLDIYSHVFSGMQDEAAQLMDTLVSPVLVDFSQTSRLPQFRGKREMQPLGENSAHLIG